jgi:predicted ATPase
MLETAMRTAISGKGGLVLLTGEPGLGKTRIAQQLAASAAQLGADSWLGRCLEVEGAPPFWPWIQIFRDCVRDRGPGEMRALLGAEGADIAQAVPELRQMLPDLPSPPPIDPVSGRFRLLDSVAKFLKRASGQRPILVTFDDLHQADRASVQLLEFVSRQATTARLLFAATFRTRLGGADAVPEALQALAREYSTRCIELRGLSKDELRQYLELVTGNSPSDAELDSLLEKPPAILCSSASWFMVFAASSWMRRRDSGTGCLGRPAARVCGGPSSATSRFSRNQRRRYCALPRCSDGSFQWGSWPRSRRAIWSA